VKFKTSRKRRPVKNSRPLEKFKTCEIQDLWKKKTCQKFKTSGKIQNL
jgi:hypothetical protein